MAASCPHDTCTRAAIPLPVPFDPDLALGPLDGLNFPGTGAEREDVELVVDDKGVRARGKRQQEALVEAGDDVLVGLGAEARVDILEEKKWGRRSETPRNGRGDNKPREGKDTYGEARQRACSIKTVVAVETTGIRGEWASTAAFRASQPVVRARPNSRVRRR